MPKYKVCVQRYVEETVAVEIEADTPEKAVDLGDTFTKNNDNIAWQAGDDIINHEVYAVLDDNGEHLWTR